MLHNFHNCNTYPPSPFVLEYTQTIPLCELQILVFILVNLTKLDHFYIFDFKNFITRMFLDSEVRDLE